jgi:hypothetical protein
MAALAASGPAPEQALGYGARVVLHTSINSIDYQPIFTINFPQIWEEKEGSGVRENTYIVGSLKFIQDPHA